MEAPFQIVGCVLSSRPAPERIDAFVALVRRERAAVMSKSVQGATFVRFNAPDASLVTLACRAIRGQVPPLLRFGFAIGGKESAEAAPEGLDISTRSIVQANELAAGARDGEVLVSAQLAVLLIEAGFALRSKQVHLPGGRIVGACSLELAARSATGTKPGPGPDAADDAEERPDFDRSGGDTVLQDLMPDAPTRASSPSSSFAPPRPRSGHEAPSALLHKGDALGAVFLSLAAQAEEMARRQSELEARQDAVLGKMTLVDEGSPSARHLGELEAALDAQLERVGERLDFIDKLEQRLIQLQVAMTMAERKLNEQLRRRADVESLKTLCDTMVAQMAEAQDQLGGVAAAQEQLLPLPAQVSALAQTLEASQQLLATFATRLGELDLGAEATAQKMKSLADREALVQAVKAEVDEVRQISSKSRADLQFVSEHQGGIAKLRAKVEDLMGRIGETDEKIQTVEARRKVVVEVQASANAITHMLGDMHLKLEMLEEQRVMIDHVGDKLARLDFTVQEAQNTLRALQREREVAERVEQGIKALRARS